jgi:glycosyltransferase involved in cell wall biosynthesis
VNAAKVMWLIKGLGLGGAERLLTSTAASIDRDRYVVEVVYLLPRNAAFEPVLEAHGIPTVCLDARWTVESAWPWRLAQMLWQGRYDLVHTHSPVPASAARLLAPRATRFVHTEHNLWTSYRRPTYVANAMTYRRNDAVVAVSDAVAATIIPRWWVGPGRQPPVETLHHGVDLQGAHRGELARRAARERIGIGEDTPIVGTVGNLTLQKDHVGLLAAIDQVRRHVPEVRLLVVGTGPQEASLRTIVRERRLEATVHFLGARTDVAELLPALDLFVLGSRFEGLPIALLEAMASGVSCVATRVGGVPEAITDGREGLLVPAGDPEALGRAIVELLNDPSARRGLAAAGVARIRRDFAMQRAVRRIEEIYEQVLTGPRSGT